MQNYEPFYMYFTSSVWTIFLGSDFDISGKLRLLLDYTAQMGLRHPSEPTEQKMVAFLLVCQEGPMGARALNPQVAIDLMQDLKRQLRSCNRTSRPVKEQILTLPQYPQYFTTRYPRTAQDIFSQDPPAPPQVNDLDVSAVARNVPCRQRASAKAAPADSPNAANMMGMFAQMMQCVLANRPAPSRGASFLDELPGLQFTMPKVPDGRGQPLALEMQRSHPATPGPPTAPTAMGEPEETPALPAAPVTTEPPKNEPPKKEAAHKSPEEVAAALAATMAVRANAKSAMKRPAGVETPDDAARPAAKHGRQDDSGLRASCQLCVYS